MASKLMMSVFTVACALQFGEASSLSSTCGINSCQVHNTGSLDADLAAMANATLASVTKTAAVELSQQYDIEQYSEYLEEYYTEEYSEYFSHVFSEYFGQLCTGKNNNMPEYCRQYVRVVQEGQRYTEYYAKYFSEYMTSYYTNYYSSYYQLPTVPSTASCPFPSSTSGSAPSTCTATSQHSQ